MVGSVLVEILRDYFGKQMSKILKFLVRLYWFCGILTDFSKRFLAHNFNDS
jgi:hypothetical protein